MVQCKLDSTMNNYPAGDWKHPRTPEVVEVGSDQKLVSSWLNELFSSELQEGCSCPEGRGSLDVKMLLCHLHP